MEINQLIHQHTRYDLGIPHSSKATCLPNKLRPDQLVGYTHNRAIILLCTYLYLIYLFGVLHRFQHCTDHITTVSFVGRGNQYTQLVKVLYCKLRTIGKQLPTFPHKVQGLNCRPQRWEASVLPLYHHGPCTYSTNIIIYSKNYSFGTYRHELVETSW